MKSKQLKKNIVNCKNIKSKKLVNSDKRKLHLRYTLNPLYEEFKKNISNTYIKFIL